MAQGKCNIQVDTHYMNILSAFKNACEICSNVALATIIRIKPEIASEKHEYILSLKTGQNEQFNELYEKEFRNYNDKLSQLKSISEDNIE